jgi:non-reducing end alpha-L-arabinofuranosidase
VGGATGTGGTTGAAGTTGTLGPCDIYQAANTPCVAAHSTVRALYGAYSGPLYQLRRKDGTTKDVPALGPGSFVDISVQDGFCSGTTCTISILYDQSPKKNHLTKAPVATWLKSGANEADASLGKITVSGHVAHGIYVQNGNNPATDVGYRNNNTTGLAKGDEPEAMYMVVDGKRYSSICCFDYGNVGTTGTDEGDATMEAMYWGNSTQWGKGGGAGPWVGADLENGMYEGDTKNNPNYPSITGFSYVTGMLKGPSGDAMKIKAGNAQSGAIETKWDGKRPAGYSPMKKVGAIILGLGGDGSSYGVGTFFEGCITSGNPPDSTDDAVQANIVAAGYGK